MDPMQDVDGIIAIVCVIMIMPAINLQHRDRVRGRQWVGPWIARRGQYGAYHALMQELRQEDPRSYKNFVRMDKDTFTELLELVTPLIKKKDTFMRNSILDIIKNRVFIVCVPNSNQEWQNVANQFEEKWQFPNCIGAMDGKHVAIKCPARSGSTYYNYKHFFSIILLAIVDADYNFVYVDVGCNGRSNDSGVFNKSKLYELLETNKIGVPPLRPLPGRDSCVPYVIVGDDAFPLKPYLLKPYPNRQLDMDKRIFNYRLSRARRISENVFGILTSRSGVFQRPIALGPDKASLIVLAICALHNFSRARSRNIYTPAGGFDDSDRPGEWRNEQRRDSVFDIEQQAGNRNADNARNVRDEYCE
ncbi:uncharacterized protein LOC123528006 [Mercenaria mercenaria]|uniref:uncharacterized protein LOC123528006 n=1 Tax=Mercenaria mercenaria TaxID=6596 RepID=UPI00234F4C35|nr:uncharacterized protein LOC123528006 [Mercenaria mercenaria]